MTDVESHADGTFSLVAVGMERIALEHLDITGTYPSARSWSARRRRDVAGRGRRAGPGDLRGLPRRAAEFRDDPYPYPLPQDPAYLSWTLAAVAPLPLQERQALLEAEDAGVRLLMVTDLLRTELRAMNVIPSLPATEVARTRWSPN